MAILINEISEKYISKLWKNYFNTVKYSEAAELIRGAVEETAEVAKKDIEQAIEPLKAKIVQKDEFISSQTKLHEELEKENAELKQSVSKMGEYANSLAQSYKSSHQTIKALQTKIDEYKPIIKEAYKQGITQEIREKKNVLGSILSGLIHYKEELDKPKIVEQPFGEKIEKFTEKHIQKPIKKLKTEVKVKEQAQVQRSVISSEIIQAIETQRKNQKLDSIRVNKAQKLIKEFLEDAPQKDSYNDIQEHFKKTMIRYLDIVKNIINGRYRFEKENFSKIRIGTDENGRIVLKEKGFDFDGDFHSYNYEIFIADGTSMEIYSGNTDSYIAFRDTEGKELLKLCYGNHYSAFISDKNGRLMVAEGIKDGAVKYLNVNFNEVKPIKEIENDDGMNVYAENLVSKAKHDCKKQQEEYRDTTDIDYLNNEGKISVHEYYVNKKRNPYPVFTYLYDTKDERLKKLITNGDFGLHAKYDEEKRCFIQYRTKGITGIDKIRVDSDLKDFRMGFYKSTENEHYETQSLYDENYKGDKDTFLQREIYEKRNYGLASKPLTKAFTFHDLTKHKIKPWDFSILKPYL